MHAAVGGANRCLPDDRCRRFEGHRGEHGAQAHLAAAGADGRADAAGKGRGQHDGDRGYRAAGQAAAAGDDHAEHGKPLPI